MAFASDTTWGALPAKKVFAPSVNWHRALFWALAAGAVPTVLVLMWPAFINAIPRLIEVPIQNPPMARPVNSQVTRSTPSAVSPFERRAESFLGDSLPLTTACTAGCSAITATIAEAEKFGHFNGASAGNKPLMTGLPMQQSFGPKPAAPVPVASASEVAQANPSSTPALVIHPTVVVPLPAVIPAPDTAPVPAPRLERSFETAVRSVPVAPVEPEEKQASIPVGPFSIPKSAVSAGHGVAVYDISAGMVYMPDGQRLEAHSGLGSMVDDPRFVNRHNVGPTPPNTYNLIMRKGRFHGVDAIRLIPANGDNKYGRLGLLAHPYMLRGRPGQSNGCVVFKDYPRFLKAFSRGEIKQIVVVPAVSGSPSRIASAAARAA